MLVDKGVYEPGHIRVKQGSPLTLRFMRKDPSPCAEKVIFSELDIAADLPVNQPVEITVPTDKAGSYEFTCQMQMYRGKLTVTT